MVILLESLGGLVKACFAGGAQPPVLRRVPECPSERCGAMLGVPLRHGAAHGLIPQNVDVTEPVLRRAGVALRHDGRSDRMLESVSPELGEPMVLCGASGWVNTRNGATRGSTHKLRLAPAHDILNLLFRTALERLEEKVCRVTRASEGRGGLKSGGVLASAADLEFLGGTASGELRGSSANPVRTSMLREQSLGRPPRRIYPPIERRPPSRRP